MSDIAEGVFRVASRIKQFSKLAREYDATGGFAPSLKSDCQHDFHTVSVL
jgi:hypothetical protein